MKVQNGGRHHSPRREFHEPNKQPVVDECEHGDKGGVFRVNGARIN